MEMLTRRQFAAGTCCLFHSTLFAQRTFADGSIPSFKCSTINTIKPGDLEDLIPVRPYSNTNDEISFERTQTQLNITPYGAAFVKDRWHRADGLTPNTAKITLGVFFLNGGTDQQAVVKSAGHAWTDGPLGQIFDLNYDVPKERSQIRIAFDSGDGNWSYVGRRCLAIPAKNKTMNIESVEDFVVEHELGHTWCLEHEHQFPGAIHWNRDQVIADMQAEQGWSPEMTRAQMLSPLSQSACVGDPKFNRDSIMLYPIRSNWTTDGFSSDWNKKISEGDIRCLAGIYNFKI
jgi:hypothetical protein